ncbi:hypothetical protein A3F66_04570 [candidate division TM6 bacterium RIFCSPHIGHO2_12_FULL_32_22]|nr:MAG: hypothetical protein A3F66_04570 [candidate division TM6 bacterium RIFCSPHIGHO2_12_FULL_32_22]
MKKIFLSLFFISIYCSDRELSLPDRAKSIEQFKAYIHRLKPDCLRTKIESRTSQRTIEILKFLTSFIDCDIERRIDKELSNFNSETSKLLRAMRFKIMFKELEKQDIRAAIFNKKDQMSQYLKELYTMDQAERIMRITNDIDDPESALNWFFYYQDTGYAKRALTATYYGLSAVGKFFRHLISSDDL